MNEDQELRRIESERWWSYREQSISHSKEYGIATVRSLILIHGAAIIATLTFVSNLKTDSKTAVDFHELKIAIAMFIVGLLLALLVGAMGYFNFQANAYGVPGPNQLHRYILSGDVTGWKDKSRATRGTTYAAIGLALVSFVQFALGSYFALAALISK
jgi:uncharacterized membrane protein